MSKSYEDERWERGWGSPDTCMDGSVVCDNCGHTNYDLTFTIESYCEKCGELLDYNDFNFDYNDPESQMDREAQLSSIEDDYMGL